MLSWLNIKLDISRFFQSPLNISLSKWVPRKIFRHYFLFLGMVYLLFRDDVRSRISNSVNRIFGHKIGILQQLKIKIKIFLGLIDHYFEKMWNIHSPLKELSEYIKSHTLIINSEWLEYSLRNGSGVLLISGHFGGVEYMTMTLSVRGYKPAIIARFKTAKLIEKTEIRAKLTNIEVINADESNVFFRASRALKEGKILITLCDEFSHWIPCKNKSITVFGEYVLQDKTLDIFHRRVKVPVCLGIMRRSKYDYKLEIHPLPITTDNKNNSIGNLSWKMLEQFIIQDPGQWYQWHEMDDTLKNYKEKRKELTSDTRLINISDVIGSAIP